MCNISFYLTMVEQHSYFFRNFCYFTSGEMSVMLCFSWHGGQGVGLGHLLRPLPPMGSLSSGFNQLPIDSCTPEADQWSCIVGNVGTRFWKGRRMSGIKEAIFLVLLYRYWSFVLNRPLWGYNKWYRTAILDRWAVFQHTHALPRVHLVTEWHH